MTDRIGKIVHRILFSVAWTILMIVLTIVAMFIFPSPWLVPLFIINIYQFWILGPLGWGDRYNDKKLDEILEILNDKLN